jgi:hypothetical protein
VRHYTVDLESPSGARATVAGYGQYGRPLLVFPTEGGRAREFADRGMVAAVADLIDAGRVKLYCVDSFDAGTWSAGDLPLEERARRHGAYESWILDAVVPHIRADTGDAEIVTTGCSMGAFHALNFAFKRADLFRWRCASPATTTRRRGAPGVSTATRSTSTTPPSTSRTCTATISTGCARGCRCCSSAGRGSGRTPPGRWSRPGGWRSCWPPRAYATNGICGVTTSRTTGRRGVPSWPTTCPGSAEECARTPLSGQRENCSHSP